MAELYSKSFLSMEALAKKTIEKMEDAKFKLFQFNGVHSYISAEFLNNYTNDKSCRFVETVIKPKKPGLLFLSHECSIRLIEDNRLTYKILINFYSAKNSMCHSFVCSVPIKYNEWVYIRISLNAQYYLNNAQPDSPSFSYMEGEYINRKIIERNPYAFVVFENKSYHGLRFKFHKELKECPALQNLRNKFFIGGYHLNIPDTYIRHYEGSMAYFNLGEIEKNYNDVMHLPLVEDEYKLLASLTPYESEGEYYEVSHVASQELKVWAMNSNQQFCEHEIDDDERMKRYVFDKLLGIRKEHFINRKNLIKSTELPRKRGRPKGSGSYDDEMELGFMRNLIIEQNFEIKPAARKAVDTYGRKGASEEAHVERLRTKYRQRFKAGE